MNSLVILNGSDAGKTISLDKQFFNIGTSSQDDFVINDPDVCHHHLTMEQKGEVVIAFDNNSVNGTKINDVPLEQWKHIHNGDKITIGTTILIAALDNAEVKTRGKHLKGFHISKTNIKIAFLLAVIAFVCLMIINQLSEETPPINHNFSVSGIILASNVKGNVTYKRTSINPPVSDRVNNNTTFIENDIIYTRDKSSLYIAFSDKSIIKIGENTTLEIVKHKIKIKNDRHIRNTILKVVNGKIKAKITPIHDSESSFDILTPSSNAKVKGTEFFVIYEEDTNTSKIVVNEGLVNVRQINGNELVDAHTGESYLVSDQELKPLENIDPKETEELNEELTIDEDEIYKIIVEIDSKKIIDMEKETYEKEKEQFEQDEAKISEETLERQQVKKETDLFSLYLAIQIFLFVLIGICAMLLFRKDQ